MGLVDARPGNNRRRGADAGVDGYINFFDDESGKAKTVLVQVKSGHVQRNVIATLKGDREREQAEMGLLVTLEPPTGADAAGSGSRRVLRAGALPGPAVPARADRDHRGAAERPGAGRAAPRPRGRADVPPGRASPSLGGAVGADAVGGRGGWSIAEG